MKFNGKKVAVGVVLVTMFVAGVASAQGTGDTIDGSQCTAWIAAAVTLFSATILPAWLGFKYLKKAGSKV